MIMQYKNSFMGSIFNAMFQNNACYHKASMQIYHDKRGIERILNTRGFQVNLSYSVVIF